MRRYSPVLGALLFVWMADDRFVAVTAREQSAQTSPNIALSICPACQPIAVKIAAARAGRGVVAEELSKNEERLGAIEAELTVRREEWARAGSLKKQKYDQMTPHELKQVHEAIELDNEAFKLRRLNKQSEADIRKFDEEIDSLSLSLLECEKTCTPATPPVENPLGDCFGRADCPDRPVVTPTPDPSRDGAKCPQCEGTAASLRAAQDVLAKYLKERAALEQDLSTLESQLLDAERELGRYKEFPDSAGAQSARTRVESLRPRVEGTSGRLLSSGTMLAQAELGEKQVRERLDACNKTCPLTFALPEPPSLPPDENPLGDCFGNTCVDTWKNCAEAGTCPPPDTDCGIPGTCEPPCVPGASCVDPGKDDSWDTCANCDVDPAIQFKGIDVIDAAQFPQYALPYDPLGGNATLPAVNPFTPAYGQHRQIYIPPMPVQKIGAWFNPLGLVARNLRDSVERWRGSMGPRPLVTDHDLKTVERFTGGQAAGLPKGVHLLLTDRGGSTGKTLGLQILNLTGRPVRLSAMPFAVQPIKRQAQQRVQQAFNRLARAAPVRLDLSAYCLEFLKAPPGPNTILRLAPPVVQKRFAPVSKVLRSAYRLQTAGALHPDSNPATYTDAIKQWSLWTVEQKLNESRFTASLLGHTKKNAEAAGKAWPKEADDMLRKVSPNRWRDIVQVLRGAGVAVPQ